MKKVSTLVGIIIIVVVAVILFGGVFAWQYFSTKNSPLQTKISAVSTQNQKAEQEEKQKAAEGWRMFTDPHLGISFGYPASWVLGVDATGNDYITPPNQPGNYNIIYVSQASCESIIQQHPGKIATCKQIGNSGVAVYDRISTDNNNSQTDIIIDQIISTIIVYPN